MGFFTDIVDKITELIKVKFEQFKLEAQGQLAHVLAKVISFLLIYLFGACAVLFLGLGLAHGLNELLGSSFLGFLILGGLFVVITVVVYFLARSNRFSEALEEAIIEKENETEEEL